MPIDSRSIDSTSCTTEPQTRLFVHNFIDRISSRSSIQYRDQLMPATIPNFIDHKLYDPRRQRLAPGQVILAINLSVFDHLTDRSAWSTPPHASVESEWRCLD